MSFNKIAKISFVAAIVLSITNADNVVALSGVEVTSTGGGYENVDEAKVSTRNATILKDVFRDIPGVYVGGTNGMNQKIYMRGLSDRGLNITIDGARQNGNTFHHNADLLIDPDLLKAVEVNAGAKSVVNGTGALGGSVVFKTVDASDLLEDGQDVGAKLKMGYTSNNKGFSQSAMVYGRAFDSLDLLAAFKHYGYGFGESGNNKRVGGDGNDRNHLIKASYSFLDYHKITLSTEHMQYKGLYPGRAEFPSYVNAIIDGRARTNNLTNILYERDTHTIKYTYNPSDLLELDVVGYYTQHERDGINNLGLATGTKWGVKTKGTKTGAKTIVETGNVKHILRYGFDYYHSENYTKPTGATPEKIDNYSFYLEDAIKYGDLTVIPGLRYEHHTLKSYDGNGANLTSYKYKFDEVSPALALDYNIGYGFGVFASYARVFRGPDLIESMRANTTNWQKNDNLKATTGNAYEFGGRYKTELSENSSLNLIAKYYKTEYKNLINDDYATGPRANETLERINTGDADIDGVELLAKLNLDMLSLSASYTHQSVKYKNRVQASGGGYLSSNIIGYRDQGDKYTFNAEYVLPQFDVLLGYNLLFFKSKNTTSASDDTSIKMPSYAVSDIYVTYMPSSGRFKGLEINAGVYNVFDKAYASHSQRTAEYTGDLATIDWEAGRNFKMNVSYKF